MTFKNLLLALTTYPEATPVPAVRRAVGLAKAFNARMSAMACEVHIRPTGRFEFLANAMLDVPALAAAETKKSANNADALLTAFETEAKALGVFGERLVTRGMPAQVPELFVKEARMSDMAVVPIPAGDYVDRWTAETLIFESGHPALVFDASEDVAAPSSIERVVVAWDGSRTAARALRDSLPALVGAKAVTVFCVSEKKKGGAEALDVDRLVAHLALHGVTAKAHLDQAGGGDIAAILRDHVKQERADLLVMGAYGHSKLREFVLGGVTHSMLAHPPVPLLLSH